MATADVDVSEECPRHRGWAMRRGHRQRLTRENDKESTRGRARYSQSVGVSYDGRVQYDTWFLRKSTSNRFEAEHVMVREGLSALDWEAADCEAAFFASYEQEELEEWERALWDLECEDPETTSWSWSSNSSSWSLDFDDEEDSKRFNFGKAASPRCVKSESCESLNLQGQPLRASRWEQAQIVAEKAAEQYCEHLKTHPIESEAVQRARRRHRDRSVVGVHVERKPVKNQIFSCAPKLEPRSLTGRPQARFQEDHDRALSFAGPNNWDKTLVRPSRSQMGRRAKKNMPRGAKRGRVTAGLMQSAVDEESEEYKAVTGYFMKTLQMGHDPEILSLSRIQNASVFSRYLSSEAGETVMFHGCKRPLNEENILRDSFRVSCCMARGRDFGTWLAYNACYSNSGYAFDDADGWRHMFICIASHHYTVLDNDTMRVVGQDCAYPQWLVKYRQSSGR
mmetsp:Transcript_25363/g.58978  ORF Transcript_25363/g.58978 Transcript_25363/m.58978 type:complete len:452 (+) Transcript_25363:82-1437(+)